ncbi:MAG: hypothetical protein IPK64_08110 [bacterium]|nr:hypothetical protein [bacterium]
MLTYVSASPLLQSDLSLDVLTPTDEALDELGAIVQRTDDPFAWTRSLESLLADGTGGRLGRTDRLAALQMLAAVGGATGARLLAAFWTQSDHVASAACLEAEPGLAPLAALVAARVHGSLDLPQLAGGTLRLVSLADQLCQEGLRDAGLDLVTAAAIVQANHGNGQVALPVERALAAAIERLLAAPHPFRGGLRGSLSGIQLAPGLVLVDLEHDLEYFPHGFPVLIDGGRSALGDSQPAVAEGSEAVDADEASAKDALDRLRMRKLVLDNIMSTSVLLEFLRDPKVTSIPGLVAEVVNRTRNPQVIEIVIGNRALHTGFANKAVPLACLRSPVNVPAKALRKFIHVKYVSKVDLKRLANDRTGIRREIGAEIVKYLDSLT